MSISTLDNTERSSGIRSFGWRVTNTELVLFLVFAVYGPSFNFGGQFRYVEALILAWGLIRLPNLGRNLNRLELALLGLFVFTGCVHVITGLINGATTAAIIARFGTYFILTILIATMALITRFEPRKILAIVFGYCLSYVFILFVGQTASAKYADIPWRLGLGMAVTIALAALVAARPKLFVFSPLIMLAMAAIHIWQEGRAISAQVFLICALLFAGYFLGSERPARVSFLRVSLGLVLLLFGAWVGILVMTELAHAGLLPEGLARKIIAQANHSQGMLAAARPDTYAALYAITIRPFLGFGTGVFDADVFAYYARLNAESYSWDGNLAEVSEALSRREWSLGIPNHSHLFGAWADAGFFAIFAWVGTLILSIYVLVAVARWRNAWTPLYLLISTANVWDVLLSPGPHRMDMAIRILILFMAVRHIRAARDQAEGSAS